MTRIPVLSWRYRESDDPCWMGGGFDWFVTDYLNERLEEVEETLPALRDVTVGLPT